MSEKLPDVKIDYVWEDGKVVFSRDYLLRRGRCCGSGCRNCPFREEKVKLEIVLPEDKQT